MFKKVLIANRGEIALRIVRVCKQFGVKTVAVYSTADRDSLHVRFADEAVCIGPPPGRESYLKIPRIIAAAEITGADAIHPGYGFLAENANFADICATSGIKFIGPTPEMISAMGDKAVAKETMKKAGVPVVPGSDGVVASVEEALAIVRSIGLPAIIKAVAGGGGRGMRIVRDEAELESAFKTAQHEAAQGFNNADVYIEKFIEQPRHVEVQVFGDQHGNVIQLGERDCSVQRRHQKLIEESPCPVIDDRAREELCKSAIRLIKHANYSNAATVEFLLDRDKNFYFIEVNARIQVEHPVTEMVTGWDLIKWQIKVAAGEPLTLRQRDITHRGVAMECRVNAEDPARNFAPCPGKIELFMPPGGPGVRVDTYIYQGAVISPYYDSMISKVIVHQPSRQEAIATMKRALREFRIEPIKTTIPACLKILSHNLFVKNEVDTSFIERHLGG